MRKLTLAFLLLSLLMPGLASAQSTPEAESPLAGTSWTWMEFQGSDDTLLIPDGTSRITFLPSGIVLVDTPCASGDGSWSDTGTLDIDLSAIDLSQCAPDSPLVSLVQDLDQTSSYVLKDWDLFIALPMDGGIHQFTPAIREITWEWVGFQGGDGSEISPKDDEPHRLVLHDDGTARIETPCASGDATWEAADHAFEIDLGTIDVSGCLADSPGGRLLRDLDQASTFVVEQGHLFIALPMDAGIHQFAPIWPDDTNG